VADAVAGDLELLMNRPAVIEKLKSAATYAELLGEPLSAQARVGVWKLALVFGIALGTGLGLVGVIGLGALVYPPSLSEDNAITTSIYIAALVVSVVLSFVFVRWFARKTFMGSVLKQVEHFEMVVAEQRATQEEVREALSGVVGVSWLGSGVREVVIKRVRA
jgi:hypothetical protein